LANKRILIIDDDPSTIEGLTAVLSPLYAVRAVSNGPAAIIFLNAEPIDLVILDLVLGNEDGLELLPLLRELTPAPILLLTAFGTRENLLRSIRAKPDDFLDKPVGLRELRSKVASLLRETGSEGDPLEWVRAWITRDFHRPLTTKALARSAGMSPSNFRRAFVERFGLTPRAYLEECRMKRAASLLRDTDSLIKEVAGQTGFGDANNFSTAFKRYHGLSPEAFRAQHRPSSPNVPPRPA
jgi:YesN/AraC family two-component response regulator